MGDVPCILRAHLLQPRLQPRMGAEVSGAAGAELVQHLEHAGRRLIRAAMVDPGQLAHQQPHRLHARPPGADVVTEVGQTARPQPPPDDGRQMAAIFQGDPTQHAMRDDHVERVAGPQNAVRERFEGDFLERHIGEFRSRRHGPRVFDVGRIEVEAPDLGVRVGGGDDQRAQAVAAAEVGVTKRRRQVRRAVAEQDRTRREP